MEVSVVILNYNTFQLTCECIHTVIEKTTGISYEIILVDNASTECDPQLFLNKFPHITLIKNQTNTGFAKGNNTGIRLANGEYILLLNSDTKLLNNAIKHTYDHLKYHKKASVVTAKLVYENGKPQSVCQRFPRVNLMLIELLRIHKFYSKQKAGKLLLGSFFGYDQNTVADWVWGAYFMFPKKLLEQLPLKKLDDAFFMYGEDMQWCMDFKKLGYEIHYCNGAEVLHYGGSSNGRAQELIAQNHQIFLQKNYTKVNRLMIKILTALLQRT